VDIEGFDEETAEELQNRARDYLDARNAELTERRQQLGVSDELAELEGLTPAMLVALGENDVKSVEDFAGCATDDLVGWNETVDGERKHMDGFLETFDLSADEANHLIMTARVVAGWIDPADLEPEAEIEEEAEVELDEDAEPTIENVFEKRTPRVLPVDEGSGGAA